MDATTLPRRPSLRLAMSFLCLLLLNACAFPFDRVFQFERPIIGGSSRTSPWAAALRALDPADTNSPGHDITAVYLHQDIEYLLIRIDLLDFQAPKDISIDILIGDDSRPEATPIDLHIPSGSGSARVSLGSLLDTVIVEMPLTNIPSRPRVDIYTPEDQITGLTLGGPVPTRTAPLLLTFYDTYEGRFPAEALRSWDGAHSGPRGERHGLKHLLDAVEFYQTPIVLLDLKEPKNLSSLDAMGVLPHILKLESEGLLILPDQPAQEIFFGLPPSPFTLDGKASLPTFVLSSDPSRIYRMPYTNTRLIPIAAGTDTSQATPDGPSLDVRRALLGNFPIGNKKDILVLGGDLGNSTWGSPDMAGPTLAYFASRPYIKILTGDDLTRYPTKLGKPEIQPYPINKDLEKLEIHYQNLTKPVLDFAENWNGSSISTCDTDVDNDEQPECVLADETYLAILDLQGARLTYLFTVRRNGIPPYTQLIGPSWQVAVGLSNPSTWDLSAGEAADPGAYPGAFTDVDDPFKLYEPTIDGNTLTFTTADGTRTKSFNLTETGIKVEYQTQEPVRTQISLLVDPGARFTPGWAEKYVQENTPSGVAWGLENGLMVDVQFEGEITMRSFSESLSLLGTPEDPDFDYPPGHYIPFPMAIAEVTFDDGTFTIQLDISP